MLQAGGFDFPTLQLAMMYGKEIRVAVIDVEKCEGKILRWFRRITLDQVMVSAYRTGGTNREDGPVESFELNAREVSYL